jgi:hypothetical protein
VIVAAAQQVSADLADEAVVLNLASGTYYGLNEVGARVWQLVQEPRTVTSICLVLVDEFDVTLEDCERDVLAILGEMRAQALVEVLE